MLPEIYERADIRGVTPVCSESGCLGISFDLANGQTARIALTTEHAEFLRGCLDDYLRQYGCHSDRSSGMPKSSGLPTEGQDVVPIASSSAACSGFRYEPKRSSSKKACQRPLVPRRIQNVPAVVSWLKATINWFMAKALPDGLWNLHRSRKVSFAANLHRPVIDHGAALVESVPAGEDQ